MNTAIARNAPTCASRLADQIAWADANGYTAMAALGVWTRIIALVWRALDTDAGADAIERVRGERPGGGPPCAAPHRRDPSHPHRLRAQARRRRRHRRTDTRPDLGDERGRRTLRRRPRGHAPRRRHASRVRTRGATARRCARSRRVTDPGGQAHALRSPGEAGPGRGTSERERRSADVTKPLHRRHKHEQDETAHPNERTNRGLERWRAMLGSGDRGQNIGRIGSSDDGNTRARPRNGRQATILRAVRGGQPNACGRSSQK